MANAEDALSILADSTRRALVEELRQGPMTAGQLSATAPVTRSAVSQHLQLLKAAALLVERREGTRRIYSLDPTALGELRTYVDGLWSDALANFNRATDRSAQVATIEFKVPPVIKTVTYAGSPEDAFDRFTLDIGRWWPLATHSLGRLDNASSVGFERLEAGAALVEQCRSGARHVWGSITNIQRPRLVSFTWHVGRPQDTAQLIEVRFDPAEDGTTRVTLTHSGWDRLGDSALEAQRSYTTGWEPVLARYAERGQAKR